MKLVHVLAFIVGITLFISPVVVPCTPAEAQIRTLPPGDYERTIIVDGLERSFKVHIPQGVYANGPAPLIIGLHGLSSNNELFEIYTEMDAKADELGFIVVYPNGTGDKELAWNAGHCCNLQPRNNVDDVAFIRELVAAMQKLLNIDANRIYATGMSNGGMLAYRLAAEASDIFAAVGPVAASIGGIPQTGWPEVIIRAPTAPVSIIAINGMKDNYVSYTGGEATGQFTDGRTDVSVAESIGFWVVHNGCDPEPATDISFAGNIITDTFACPDGIDVVLITIVDGEHAWPGSPVEPAPSLPQPNQQISATDMILKFFAAHAKTTSAE
ncbi:MAG: prolyl oligopeptidase family serine peptidase [Anaerolineae bacterium]|nr:prolyl oligopeptidase family serine peptidase [Anaerolineae bacterium]